MNRFIEYPKKTLIVAIIIVGLVIGIGLISGITMSFISWENYFPVIIDKIYELVNYPEAIRIYLLVSIIFGILFAELVYLFDE